MGSFTRKKLEKDPTFQAKDENIKKKFKSLNNDHGYS